MSTIVIEGWPLFKAFQQNLHRNLGAETAGVRLTGGQAAVFPELVAAIAATAEAEVLAAFLATVNPLAHIREQPLELFCFRRFLQ